MARPTKLTPEVEERLVHAISVGASFKDACAHARISFQTLQNWKKRARRAAEQAGEPGGESEDTDQFVEFLDRIKKAEADAAVGWLSTMNKAARRDWKAAAWMLERRYPESYNLRRLKPDRLDGGEFTPAPGPASGLDKEGATKILEAMRKHGLLPPDQG